MFQLSFAMSESASAHIESLLPRTCPVHPGTTLDGRARACEMCAIASRAVAELDAVYARLTELEAEDGTRTETYIRLEERSWELESAHPVTSPWVAKAAEASLPYKSFR